MIYHFYSAMEELPVEIFHSIFDYLNPFDIFSSFSSLNNSINEKISSYRRLKINFRSIEKWKCEYLCELFQGNQVQSLCLSNDEESPGQINLFLSYFSFYRFDHLQSIDLKGIDEANLLYLIFSHLENHPQLESISIETKSISINKRISRSLVEIFSTLFKLKTLKYFNSSSLIDLRHPLQSLAHLTLHACQFHHLNILLPFLPNLTSLHLYANYSDHDRLQPLPQFSRIPLERLKIQSEQWLQFDHLENFLRCFPSLESLIVETRGDEHIIDGNRWKQLLQRHLPQLKRLELNLSPEENHRNGNDTLLPFQNSFWIDEKRLKLACFISRTTDTCVRLFTIPYFYPKETWYPIDQGFYYYSHHSNSIDQYSTSLGISHYPSINPNSFVFSNVQLLSLESPFEHIDRIQQIFNFSSIEHLKLNKSFNGRPLMELLLLGSNIHHLTVHRSTVIDFLSITFNDHPSFDQIQRLNIEDSTDMLDFARLSKIFPQLKRLSLHIRNRDEILQVFNAFPNLISANFRWSLKDRSFTSISSQWFEENGIVLNQSFILNDYRLDVWFH